jgi:gas vesicle protein
MEGLSMKRTLLVGLGIAAVVAAAAALHRLITPVPS